MQLKIVVLSGGSKKWCFDRLERDMMIFCEWLMEGVIKFFFVNGGMHTSRNLPSGTEVSASERR